MIRGGSNLSLIGNFCPSDAASTVAEAALDCTVSDAVAFSKQGMEQSVKLRQFCCHVNMAPTVLPALTCPIPSLTG